MKEFILVILSRAKQSTPNIPLHQTHSSFGKRKQPDQLIIHHNTEETTEKSNRQSSLDFAYYFFSIH